MILHSCTFKITCNHKRECNPPMRGTESDVAGMISATRSMKTVSERSTVMPWDREGERGRERENTSLYVMMRSGSLVYEISPVITYVSNQLCSRDCNHLSAAGSSDVSKVGYSSRDLWLCYLVTAHPRTAIHQNSPGTDRAPKMEFMARLLFWNYSGVIWHACIQGSLYDS